MKINCINQNLIYFYKQEALHINRYRASVIRNKYSNTIHHLYLRRNT